MTVGEPGGGYTFDPADSGGLLLGLRAAQLAALGTGALLALIAVTTIGGPTGAAIAAVVAVLAALGACWPIEGRPPVEWAPVAGSWLLRRLGGPRHSDLPGRGIEASSPAPIRWPGSGPVRPPGHRPPRRRSPRRRRDHRDRPAPDHRRTGLGPAGIALLDVPGELGDEALGVIRDRRSGTWAGVVAVAGRSFALLDGSDQRARLAAWGALLAGLGRPGSPVVRLQWVQRVADDDPHALRAQMSDTVRPTTAGAARARLDYEDLIAAAALSTRAHETLLVLAVRPRRGSGDPLTILRRELRLLRGQLANAELDPGPALDHQALTAALRHGLEPTAARRRPSPERSGPGRPGPERPGPGRPGPERPGPGRPGPGHPGIGRSGSGRLGAWPLATDEDWSALRADGGWHATYWVAEWPRVETGPDFLVPLLLAGRRRSVSVIMAPVPMARATREVESARTASMADDELRRRAGFLATARRQRSGEGMLRREAELADGHVEYRFSGYVTVTGADRHELDQGCAEVEHAAQSARLELRRLWGQQADAFTWTLPLARGLT